MGDMGDTHMTSTTIEPIEWPKWYNSSNRYFLEGVPFIGIHSRILRKAKLSLKRRAHNETNILWKDYYEQVPSVIEREKVFRILDHYLNWPNHNFIPTDRASIVLGFIPGIWIDPDDIIDDIIKEFNLKKKLRYKRSFDLYESASGDLLIDFFRTLSS